LKRWKNIPELEKVENIPELEKGKYQSLRGWERTEHKRVEDNR